MARKGIPFLNFDDLITAIQALSAPSATNVAVDPTGMEIITANNSQGALKQLDTAVDSVNSSLTNNESFNLTLSPSLTGVNVGSTNCFYNEATKLVHIDVLYYSSSGNIPANNTLIATVPAEYKPTHDVNTMVHLTPATSGNYAPTQWEKLYLNATTGNIVLNNFMYGTGNIKAIHILVDYYI